ncbi:YbaK/EbsC family protein [Caulobacter segnis]
MRWASLTKPASCPYRSVALSPCRTQHIPRCGAVRYHPGPCPRAPPPRSALTKAGVAFDLHTYEYDPGSERVGLQAAEALGEDPRRVLKTLVVMLDGKPACAILPSDREVSMKKLAAALKGKSAAMAPCLTPNGSPATRSAASAPFGQKKRLPTVKVEEAALAEPYVFINGGQRGLQVKLAPADAGQGAGGDDGGDRFRVDAPA